MRLIGVYGSSGFGREVMPLVREEFGAAGGQSSELVFIDDHPVTPHVNGHRVDGWSAFCELNAADKAVTIAVANSAIRERLAARCAEAGVRALSVKAANVVVMDDVVIGEGAILPPFVTLTSNVRIGRYFHANLYSYVAHDCLIGDFVTFAPAVRCNGNVVVEDHAYIGTGAILRQGQPGAPLVIGRGAIVGMGAVVTKSVPPGVTVVGNPARPMAKG